MCPENRMILWADKNCTIKSADIYRLSVIGLKTIMKLQEKLYIPGPYIALPALCYNTILTHPNTNHSPIPNPD